MAACSARPHTTFDNARHRHAMARHHLDGTSETCHWGFFEIRLKPVPIVRSGGEIMIDTIVSEYFPRWTSGTQR